MVGDYLESGSPVGSKAIAEKLEGEWGPSTIRAELAALERQGLLTHPHTSAGRMPTDSGYRLYAGALLVSGLARGDGLGSLDLSRMRREVDEAMRLDHGGTLADDRPSRPGHGTGAERRPHPPG